MLAYVLRRAAWSIPVILLATILAFSLVKAMPYETSIVTNPRYAPSVRQNLIELYGFNKSAPRQYVDFVSDFVRGDFGISTKPGNRPVRDIIGETYKTTLFLGFCAFIFSALVGTSLGVISALRANGVVDYAITLVATSFFAFPSFVVATLWVQHDIAAGATIFALLLGLALLALATSLHSRNGKWIVRGLLGALIASYAFSLIPGAGNLPVAWNHAFARLVEWGIGPQASFYGWEAWNERLGPILVLGLSIMPYFTRLVRASMLEALQQEYIVTARSKGIPWRRTVFRHALRNSLIPTVTNAGPLFAFVLTGSFIIERILSVPGVASVFVDAFKQPIDSRMVLATTVLLSGVIIVLNLVVDVLVAWLDPRISHG